jgi:hypothetical protein
MPAKSGFPPPRNFFGEKTSERIIRYLFNHLFLLHGKDSKDTKMKKNAPVVVDQLMVLPFDKNRVQELDPEMLEIEEAKTHFEDQADSEEFWAGRLLADRKTTRIAA